MRKELKHSIIDLDADHYRLDEFMRVIDEIFVKYRNEIEQLKIDSWIPCSDRLPENGAECLIFYYNNKEDKNLVDIAYLDDDGCWQLYR